MHDDTTAARPELRTFATFDAHGGKVTKRVEVLPAEPRDDGLVAIRGEHPLGAEDERAVHGGTPTRGDAVDGWADPAALRDWYAPHRVVVPLTEARAAGLEPGLFADTRARGRVRIADAEGHVGPDGRAVFRALVGPVDDPRVDHPLPREEAVRIVEVHAGASTDDGAAAVLVVTLPVAPVLAPGLHPDRADDRAGLPPAAHDRRVRVRAFVLVDGERREIDRVDAAAGTMWLVSGDGPSVPVAMPGSGGDLVRYETAPE
jgi:hypothetical protein